MTIDVTITPAPVITATAVTNPAVNVTVTNGDTITATVTETTITATITSTPITAVVTNGATITVAMTSVPITVTVSGVETDPIFAASAAASFVTGDAAKLAGIETGAEVNNISDINAADLTDGGATTLHTHAGGGVTAHSALTQLDYASAGHTGFQPVLGYTPLNPASNLSDVASAATARTNLGLGAAALLAVPITAANGGTGIANGASATLTLPNVALTLAAAGAYTLTIPATGTAALLATANVFTAGQTITVTNIPTALTFNHTFTDGTINNFTIANTTTLTASAAITQSQRILNFTAVIAGSGGTSGSGDFVGLQLDISNSQTSGTSVTLYGSNTVFRNTNAGITSNVRLHNSSVLITGTGNLTLLYHYYAAGITSHTGTGTVTAQYGYYAANQGDSKTSLGYAFYAAAQSGATGTNFAFISAGLGLNQFNDQLNIIGGANRNQLIVTGFTTQTLAPAQINRNDAAAGVSAMLGLTALGSGAVGDGGSIPMAGKSSTTAATAMALIDWRWVVATHASRTAAMRFYAYDSGGARLGLEIEASGTEPKIGIYGVTPIARAVLATGAGKTVDDVILCLQNFGILRQS